MAEETDEQIVARIQAEAQAACDSCAGLPTEQQGTWCGRCFEQMVFDG